METIKSLQDRRTALARAARHLLNEKGAQRWSSADQQVFDSLTSELERTDSLIEVMNLGAEPPAVAWARSHSKFDNFIRGKTSGVQTVIKGAMGTVAGGQGGYTVDPIMGREVVNVLKGYGWMRQVASQITTTSGAPMSYPTSDGTTEVGERVGENTQVASLDVTFGTDPLLTTKYSSKLITVPMELLQDTAVDLVSFLVQRATERIGRLQNLDFTVGTGTNQPVGVVTAAGIGKTAATGGAVNVLYNDLVDVMDSVDEACLGMPSKQADVPTLASTGWMFNQFTRKILRRIVDSNGRPIWLPACGDSPPMLLDYPVHINNDMPSPAANAKPIAFGAFSKYLIRDALDEIVFLRFDDSAFATKGQVGFLAFARAAGNLMDPGAVKLFQNSAT